MRKLIVLCLFTIVQILFALPGLAELPHFPIHSLRHTHASNLANTSIPIKKLSNRLGHSDISTTMNVYSHAHVGDDSSYLEKANVRRA